MNKLRLLIKVSGESLLGESNFGLDISTVNNIAKEIKNVTKLKHQICLILGGGNIYRGISGASEGADRSTSAYMGMLATLINSLCLQNALEKISVPTRVQSAITMSQISEPYIRRRAIRHLEKNRIVIFGAGTGNPFFTTDTAASLRASEMNCNLIIKGTKVDGVYDKDPKKYKNAKFFKNLKYDDILKKNLRVMDQTAIILAKESKIPIYVTNIKKKNSLINVIKGIGKFTKIS